MPGSPSTPHVGQGLFTDGCGMGPAGPWPSQRNGIKQASGYTAGSRPLPILIISASKPDSRSFSFCAVVCCVAAQAAVVMQAGQRQIRKGFGNCDVHFQFLLSNNHSVKPPLVGEAGLRGRLGGRILTNDDSAKINAVERAATSHVEEIPCARKARHAE